MGSPSAPPQGIHAPSQNPSGMSAPPPIRIKLARDAAMTQSVWVAFGPSMPADFQLLRAFSDWLSRHAADPFRTSLQDYANDGHLTFRIESVGTTPAPALEALRSAGLGSEEEARLARATHEVVVTASDAGSSRRLDVFAMLAAARAFALTYDGAIMDRDVPRVLPLAAAHESIAPGLRVADLVVVAHARGDLRTLGMRKLQLPEIALERIPADLAEPLRVPLGALAQILAYRARKALAGPKPTPEVAVAHELILDLGHEALTRIGYDAPCHPNARRASTIRLELIRPALPALPYLRVVSPVQADHATWLRALLDDLLGHEEIYVPPPPSAADLEAGHRKALEELPILKARYKQGLPRGHHLYVRRAFRTPKGPPEYMWILVSGWYQEMIRGTLANVPRVRTDLIVGQSLQLHEEDVFDWLIRTDDGAEIGGYTVAAEERGRIR